jgi:hypothetical protein
MRSTLPGLTLEPAFLSKSSNTRRAIPSSGKRPSNCTKRKKPVLQQDPLLHEDHASKRIKKERMPSGAKQQEDDEAKRRNDEELEDALLWSHFDDYDWDIILPLIRDDDIP